MKKQLVIALWMLGIVQFAFGENKTISYTVPQDFSTAKIVDSAYDGYKDIEYNGLDVILEPAGAPRLLTDVVSIDVPKKSKLVKATYEAEWVTIGENIKIVPVQPLIIGEEAPKEIPFVEPDPALYAAYPASPISTFGVQRMAGKHFVPVRIFPFRYTNGKLEAAKKFVVTIEIEAPPPLMQSMSTSAHEIPAGDDYVKNDPNQPDYILIYPHNYKEIWEWYVSERRKDHPEKVMLAKDFDEILAAFPVNTDDPNKGYYARNDAERLHAYIRQEAHRGTHYFVLAGSWYDAHGCPADGHITETRKELTVTTPQAQYKTNSKWGIPGIYTNPRNDAGTTNFDPGAKPCPSDLFYACCDLPDGAKYPWDYGSYDVADPEGDKWYANEPDDRIDLVPDVVVTRIGFICGMTWRPGYETLTMEDLVKGYREKVRKVESEDFAGRNRFAGAGASFSAEPGLTHGSTLREEMEFYAGTDNVFDKRHKSYWLDTDYVVTLYLKDWFSRYLPALHTEYISETTLPPWEPDWATAVKNLHKQDWEIQTVMSHGSQGGSMSQVYINEYAQTATGLTKIFFAPFPCLMSYPDWSNVGNRSGTHKLTHNHSMIENPTGGAAFTIGNTRSGWGGGIINRDCSVGDGLGDKMGGYFVKAYVRDRKNPGDAWLHMIQTYAAKGVGWSTGRWILVIDQALGDPLLETRFLSDYTWEGEKSGTDTWDLSANKWMHVDEEGNEIHGRYEHAAKTTITAEGALTLDVAANAVGTLHLEVNQPDNATFKLTGGNVRVATDMVVSAGNVTFGVGGGVGHEGLEFTEKGNIRFEGDKKFYLAKIKNGGTVTFAGSNGLLDFRNFYWTFDGFAEPIVTKKVTGKTLDIEALAFDGTGTGNIIRSDYPGVLTQYLPAKIENQQFRLETYNGFEGALAAEKSLEIVNGKMTFANNPNYGLAEDKCFEAIDIPLTLDNSTLEVERINTFMIGRDTSSTQTITVRGNSAISATDNGRIGLYGTTTINLDNNANLSLSAPLDDRGNGKLVFTGSGTLTVENSTALVGDVEIGEGITVFFKAVPLPNVKNLVIGNNARIVLPKNNSGAYQLTPIVGSKLTVGEGVTFYNGSLDNLIENCIANSNGSVFDPNGVLSWLGANGGKWGGSAWYSAGATKTYADGSGVLFADTAGSVPVQTRDVSVDGMYVGKFMQFVNAEPYTFTGTADNATLAFGTMTVGGDAQFKNLDLIVSGRADLMNGKVETDRINVEELSVYDGATFSAGKVGFNFDKIRFIRLYFLNHLNNEPNKTKEHRVRMEEIYFNYKDENGGDHTIRNGDISWKGASGGCWVNGNLNVLFDGADAHTMACSSEKQYSAELVANAETGLMDMAAGKVYLQVNLNHAIPMLSSFGVHSSKRSIGAEMTEAYRPTRFRIEASYDGVTYYKIMPTDGDSFGSDNVGGDTANFYGGWVGGNSTSFKCNYQSAHPASVEVQGGGTLSAEGDYDAKLTLADGVTVKAVAGKQLTASETSTWTFAEGGKVQLDATELNLTDEPQVVLEDANNFTFATLYQFEPTEGASLRYLDGGKIAVVKSDDMKGPYTRIFGGEESWNTNTADGWHYYGEDAEGARLYLPFEKSWSEQKLDVATDVVIDLSADARITVDCDVEIDTIRACETNSLLAGRSMIIASDGTHTIKAQKLDFSGFDGDVTYGLDCGAARVVAGLSLKLLGTGTGVLEVPSGATATLTQPWQGTIEGNGKIVLEAENGTWTDLSLFTRTQVPTIEIPEGFRLALPPDNSAAISAADVKKLVGRGEICYYGDGASTYETIPSTVFSSTLKMGVDNGVFDLGDISVPGLIVGPKATFSATSLADTSKIRYIRVYFKSVTGNNIRLSRFRVSANGRNIGLGGSVTCTGATSYSGLGMLTKAEEPQWIEFMLFGGDFPSITATPEKYANREVYLTFNLSNAIEMFDQYAIQSAQNGWGTPTSWDVEVSTDGQEFVLVGSATANISGDLKKYTGTASRVAPLNVASGGALAAKGSITAKISFAEGAIIKAVPGEEVDCETLTLGDKAEFIFPETGMIKIDLSDVVIERGSSVELIGGKTFTEDELKRFKLINAPTGYHLEIGDGGALYLRSAEHLAPRIIIR